MGLRSRPEGTSAEGRVTNPSSRRAAPPGPGTPSKQAASTSTGFRPRSCALRSGPHNFTRPPPKSPSPRAFGGRSDGSRVLSLCCSGPERHRRSPDRPGPTRRILDRASLLRRLRRDCGSGGYRFNPGWSPRKLHAFSPVAPPTHPTCAAGIVGLRVSAALRSYVRRRVNRCENRLLAPDRASGGLKLSFLSSRGVSVG